MDAQEMNGVVDRRLDGSVAVLTMRYPPHNLLEPGICADLVAALGWAADQGARAVVLQSGLRHFSAGADLDV
ncbi:MAG TPA: enoyl-CoA hydratase-related protein, partial [Thermoleophilaceae bacterium]|nr:enoyl-CoA hydratase-related protein [Thermoleophilaceae bacterium]